MMRSLTLALVSLAATGTLAAQTGSLMPVPRSVQWGAGRLALDSASSVTISGYTDGRLTRAVRRVSSRMLARTGMRVRLEIVVTGAGQAVQGLDEDESYSLDVTPLGARLTAFAVVGAIRGLETLLQLVDADSAGFFIPAVEIDDEPRFPWRGLLVDAGRHFMPVEVIKRTLDGMAAVKLNVLHWHLSEDQGFRVESRRYPLLQERGSDSLFYTQAQIREVIAYARDRGIRVVPEFDMPGHSTSWFVGYPRYSAGTGPYTIERRFGVFDPVFDPTREEVYTFLDRFIGEMAPLFPDAYWHIGGDEVPGTQWNANPAIAAFKQRRGFADNEALQAYFNQRLIRILAKHGKKALGWDEILHRDLPTSAAIQSWRGAEFLVRAAKQGYSGLMSAGYYLDHQSTAEYHYLNDPLPVGNDLTPEQQRLVLGGEACMWAEHVTPETVDSRIWPRVVVVAERLWSPREVNDVGDMYRRLRITSARLEELGLQHESHTARMLRRIYGTSALSLEPFFELVQPATFGQRSQLQRPTQLVPLTGAVDAARPDPPGRWRTEALVTAALAGDAAATRSLGEAFGDWRRQAGVAMAFEALRPAALVMDSVAMLGEAAVRNIGRGGTDSVTIATLRRWEQPQGLLRVWGARAVRRLLEGTRP